MMNQIILSGNLANSTVDAGLATFDDFFGNHLSAITIKMGEIIIPRGKGT